MVISAPAKIEYLDEFNACNGDKYLEHILEMKDPSEFIDHRWRLIEKYSFAVPNLAALGCIAKYGPIIEIGAGRGYWAMLLKEMGVDIIAVDKKITRKNYASFREGKSGRTGQPVEVIEFTEIEDGHENTILDYPDRNLLLCWPPYAEPMALNCIRLLRSEYLIYVGEGWGGCTGCDDFGELINNENYFELVDEVNIPQWEGIHDYLYVYRNKMKRQ